MSIITQTALLLAVQTSVVAGTNLAVRINEHPVTHIQGLEHPYAVANIRKEAAYMLRLELYDSEPNEIYDEDEWFDDYGLPYREPPVSADETPIPRQTKYGHLCFLRNTEKLCLSVYETKYELNQPVGIHDTAYLYTFVALKKTHDKIIVTAVYDMSELFPSILELCWLEVIGDYVYFNAAYNDFAELTENKTGYLYCFDINTGTIIWTTKNLVSSSYGFTVYEDYIITGYGFTNEDDFLYVIDRFTGEIVQTIPIKTAHEHIIAKGSFFFVRTYNTNYIFRIVKRK